MAQSTYQTRLKLAVFVTVLSVVTGKPDEVQDPRCPNGFFRIRDYCYKGEEYNLRTWDGAQDECENLGGRLAVPHNVFKLQKELKARYGAARFWLGGSDRAREGDWRWINGEPINKKYWLPHQPNDCCGGEDCLTLGTLWEKPLNDNRCSNLRKYVCEVKASDSTPL